MNYETATSDDLEVKLAELLGMDSLSALNAPRYCTDWNATMPLAIENGISLLTGSLDHVATENWYCYSSHDYTDYAEIDHNPLRAIVICLIKVLEAKSDSGQK